MIKIGIIVTVTLFVLFMFLAYIGTGLKGILVAYFVLLGITSLSAFCLFKAKRNRKEGIENAK